MRAPQADATWMKFGDDIEQAIGAMPKPKTPEELRIEQFAQFKIETHRKQLGAYGLVNSFNRLLRLTVSVEARRKMTMPDLDEVLRKHPRLFKETTTVTEFFEMGLPKLRLKPEEVMIFNQASGCWISYLDVIERTDVSQLTLGELKVMKRDVGYTVDLKAIIAALENEIFEVEKLRVKITVKGNFGKRSYKAMWPTPVSATTLAVNWIQKRLASMQVYPEEVQFTLPDGRKADGIHLVSTKSKLRITDLRFKDEDLLPVGTRPTTVGALENKILQQEGVMVVLRLPANNTLPYFFIKRSADNLPVQEYVRRVLSRYELNPEDVVFIHGDTMRPFNPDEFYTMGQLRETYKGKAK
ncbi:hypothetical protein STRATTON_76 [Erwinia phage vB_EamM_Stratton]|uniref:Uncharacterized protein n=1 Tax=Erwinia phage vB_EamM_Stratton TaxID=1883378 RepID=A0A1B2IGV6_9CAUD|nr:hypothetical protein STRATTON_76 [Erwinia phage vB_EamM_Stratton]